MVLTRIALAIVTLTLAVGGLNARAEEKTVETVYHSGNIYTVDADRPRAEAIGVRGDRIVAVGSNEEVRRAMGADAKTVDLEGRTVLPGLIDAHGHLGGLGSYGLGRLDFSEAKSFDEVVAMVAARAKTAAKGEWILGGRWDHESWPGKQLPTHEALSAVTPDNPVWLLRVDGHAGLANAAAMRIAGVSRETAEPMGGDIITDASGDPTGVFVDNAESLIAKHVEGLHEGPAALLLKAQEMCVSVGLTGAHDAGISPTEAAVYREVAESGRLKLRVYAMISGEFAKAYFAEHGLTVTDRLTIRSCKLYADGAMGSRGAWMLEPYSDRPTDEQGRPFAGLAVLPPEVIAQAAKDALAGGYQVCTHAIGDRGNREVLDAYAAALKSYAGESPRFRIEHAQLLSPADIPRFAELGVIASMQPTHCTSDMRWVAQRVGETRAKGAYAWGDLLRSGARIAAGSDFPVESQNPFLGLYAAITRQNTAGEPEGGWHSEQRMTREEALRAFTLDAAYASFEEKSKGSLEAGKLADFIVIDRDVMTCDPQEIVGTHVLRTVIGGEAIYSIAGDIIE